MKIRFGVGLGAGTSPSALGGIVDELERVGIDSLWFSEQVASDAVDPFVGMAYALSRTERLKVGTSVAILPGRHPVLVGKQLASLAALAPRRVLPAFGLRPARPAEAALFPVPEGRRADVFDESLQLLRAVLTQPSTDFDGEFFRVKGAQVGTPAARPLDLWLGGSAPAGLRRIGRLADGWLGSFLTPEQAGAARATIAAAAQEAGREIEDDHYGTSILLAPGGVPAALAATIGRRTGTDPADLVPTGWPQLHRLLDGFVEQGLSKFVIHPAAGQGVEKFVEEFTRELLPRQN